MCTEQTTLHPCCGKARYVRTLRCPLLNLTTNQCTAYGVEVLGSAGFTCFECYQRNKRENKGRKASAKADRKAEKKGRKEKEKGNRKLGSSPASNEDGGINGKGLERADTGVLEECEGRKDRRREGRALRWLVVCGLGGCWGVD
jgi:hypothetical protein